ncbi:MAG TPA: hypothetical protein VFG24_03315, partial [Nitrosopumilaceae archaeon]|nr:hypothetical protein [Nitrosopumilaceae archaeon]
MPVAYGIGGLIQVPQGAITTKGVPHGRGSLGQNAFDISDPANPVEYVWNGIAWATAGANPATTTTYGTVLLTDNNQPVATKFYADNLAIAGAPVSTTTTAGIGQLATDPEAIAGTASTPALALFVTPSNLAAVFAAPPATGGTTPGAGTFTTLAATSTLTVTGLSSLNGSATIVTGATALNLGADASTGAINIGTGAGA